MIETLGSCLVCGHGDLVRFLDLGGVPLVNSFRTDPGVAAAEPRYPLEVHRCRACAHVQLGHSVSPRELFEDYIYFSGTSEAVVRHAATLVELAGREVRLGGDSLVVEIASNDGTVLKEFARVPVRVLGVEPARNVAAAAERRGIPTVSEFFTEAFAQTLSREHGDADVVLARNVLAHVPDLRGFAAGIRTLLAPRGAVFIEVPYLMDLLEHLEFDTIYHEHLSYFSVRALVRLFDAAGLELYDVERIRMHGGSLMVRVQRPGAGRPRRDSVRAFLEAEERSGLLGAGGLESFARRVGALTAEIGEFVRGLKRRGMRLAGYGASAKGNVLMSVCGLGRTELEFIVDRSPYKHGFFTPGTAIPVHPVERLEESPIDCLFLLAWNFADEVIRQQRRFAERGGRFAVPVPRPRFVDLADIEEGGLDHLASTGRG
ncbi:MAG TPA: class I SAM-dependent methyltransferase [Solirubrobacterales bacterium]|nr:class I SAM-dependent methyltransferase [Solirubrobacterales bacterium]